MTRVFSTLVAVLLMVVLGMSLASGQSLPNRPSGSLLDPGNPLSGSLAGLFVMNEATGTTEKNLVSGQTAILSGGTLPTWNTTDPSVTFNGGTSLSSYLNAGTDLAFDQLTPNKITVVAKIYVSTLTTAGVAEKNDGNSIDSGFVFGFDSTGALQLMVEKSSVDMTAKSVSGAVSTGQWVQVAFTWDGTAGNSSAAHLFVNGVEQTKNSTTDGSGTIGYLHATNSPFRIGNASFGPTGSLNGKIAYLAVYKYRILTSAEMNQLDSQLPLTTGVIVPISENGIPVTATSTISGQSAHFPFQGWKGQAATVQFTNNTLGAVTASLISPDGTTLASAPSSSAIFNLPAATLPSTGTYDILVQPTASGSITASLVVQGARVSGSSLDTSSPLSTNLTGLFVMDEGSGTTDKNLVDGQNATFSGTTTPTWNSIDPSLVLSGNGSLSSYLNAGTDLNFDQLTTNKTTLVAKVFVDTIGSAGVAEKNDGNSIDSGFVFGWDNTGALQLMVEKSTTDMNVKSGTGTITAGQWIQVAFTWDGTIGTAAAGHLFLNGVEQTKSTAVDGSGTLGYQHATSSPFRIGNASFGPTGSLNGKIAYLAVYRGRILTALEMAALDSQLPITNSVITPVTESGTAVTATTAQAGQNVLLPFQGWSEQQVTVQLNNNTMGSLVVSLLQPNGTVLATASSSAASFDLSPATLSTTGLYNVSVRPIASATGSVSVDLLVPGARLSGSVIDESNALTPNLVGLFTMGEGSGTVDRNLVNGQSATFSGSFQPVWNTADPSVIINGGGSLGSYLNVGTDINFDRLTPGKVTLVAKVFVNTLSAAGIVEKNDEDTIDSGLVFGWDNSGALHLTVEKSIADLYVHSPTGTVFPNQWMQLAFTWDGTVGTGAGAHLYLNGVEQTKASSNDGSGTIGFANATNAPLRIGNASFDVAGSLAGKMAYLAIYRGRILTPTELNQLDSQLPINNVDLSGTIPSSSTLAMTVASPGQNARLLLPATAGQNLVAWISNNNLGPLAATIYNIDGTVLSTTTSSASAFAPPPVIAPITGIYAVYIRTNGTATGSLSVTAIPPSTPTVSISFPSDGSHVYLSSPPTLTATASTNNGASISKVDYFEGQTLLGTSTAAPFTFVLNAPSPGTHNYFAKVTDSNGMVAQSSTTGVSWVVPQISGFSPVAGLPGTPVTITGTGLGTQSNNSISFNGVPVNTVTSWTDSQVVVAVPQSASTGPLKAIFNNTVEVDTSSTFEVPNPVITAVNPPEAPPGGTITISGRGFGGDFMAVINGTPTVVGTTKLNGVGVSSLISWSDTEITVVLGSAATTGGVTITRYNVTSNAWPLTVEGLPTVTSMSPAVGPTGSTVTISGTGFGSAQSTSTVQFFGAQATISNWTDTEITANVPPGTATGPVSVTVAGLTGPSQNFTVTSTVQITDSLGHNSSYTFEQLGGKWNNFSSTGSGCSSCSVRGTLNETHDALGNLLTSTDELLHTTTYTYDSDGQVLSVSTPLDGSTPVTTSYTYNSFGEPLTVTDPLGNVTTNTYDASGNLLTITSPVPAAGIAASVTQFAYDTKGELTQITDPLNHISTLAYYPTGLIHTITDAQSNVTSYEYDLRGNRTAVVDAQSNRTTFTYDSGNRLTKVTYPDTTFVTFAYDTRGRRTTVTDQNGKVTSYAYDDADRLTSVTDAALNVTTYAYDLENNLTSITDAAGHTTSFVYDAFGRVTQTAFPSTLTENYGYDAIGNLISKVDRKNQTILYVYDALNRLSHKGYPDATGVDYVYDLAGKIKQVTDPTGTYGFAYDNMGRRIGTTTQYSFLPGTPAPTFSNSYSYDAASDRTGFTAPDGSTNTYAYDTLGRLCTLTNSLTGQFTYSYDSLSRRTALNRPNGVNTSYSYDSVSRLLNILHRAGTVTIDGEGYTYDNAGNRTAKTNYLNNITENYTYDPIYQLAQVTQGTTTTESYNYDAVGNRLSSLGISPYAYNSSNELTSTPATTFTYDANGNTLTKVDSNGTTTYSWDFENRLASVVLPGAGGTVTFKYDPGGRRIQKSSSATTTNYLYDGSNTIVELDQTGVLSARYTLGTEVDESLAMLRGGATLYYDQDGLGSATTLTGSVGTIGNSYLYDAFGNITTLTGGASNPYTYTGRDLDSETGLRYYRGRYYDPTAGRFITEDPIEFGGGINFYAYVGNDPTNLTDPFGLCPPNKCDDKDKKLAEMNRQIEAIRGNKASDFKGLAQRMSQYLGSKPGEGYADPGHVEQYNNIQNHLIELIRDYINSGCGDPPDSILDWATKPLPKLTPSPGPGPSAHPLTDWYWKHYPFTGPFWDSVREWQNEVERGIMRGPQPLPGLGPVPAPNPWPWWEW
jgi:RHS repeat-associated protein